MLLADALVALADIFVTFTTSAGEILQQLHLTSLLYIYFFDLREPTSAGLAEAPLYLRDYFLSRQLAVANHCCRRLKNSSRFATRRAVIVGNIPPG